jgi:hypothetical protein
MPARSTAARLWISIEDRLIPALRLTTHERSLYYHLLRRTRLVGRRAVRVSRRKLAAVMGLSTYTARHYLRVLARKKCVRFLDRGSSGCLVTVLLPDEAFAELSRAPATEQLASLTHRPPIDRDAAGQPRAWPRTDHFRNEAFREKILKRDRHRCFYCRRPLSVGDWSLDHVIPVVHGGLDLASNLVACCARCNFEKALSPAVDFLKSLASKRVLSPTQLRSRLKTLHSLLTTRH